MKKTRMLKKNYEFKNVLFKGTYFSGKYIEAFIKKNGKKHNMLGIAISVKIGKAVKRNHIKNEYFCQCCGKPLDRDENIDKSAINKRMVLFCSECLQKRRRETSARLMKRLREQQN